MHLTPRSIDAAASVKAAPADLFGKSMVLLTVCAFETLNTLMCCLLVCVHYKYHTVFFLFIVLIKSSYNCFRRTLNTLGYTEVRAHRLSDLYLVLMCYYSCISVCVCISV